MALGTPTAANTVRAGGSASRPLFHTFLTFAGDDAYAAGGTANFSSFVASALGQENADVLYVVNELHSGATAGGVTVALAEAKYDVSEDKLLVRSRATGTEATAGDISALVLHVHVVHH